MRTVGMKMLKESLSTYVAQARDGEHFIITDRGEEVAELVPLSPERRAIMRLVADGRAQWSGQRPQIVAWGVSVVGSPVSDAVFEDRR